MHWPVPASLLRPLIPAHLTLETYDGSAWIGIVPFLMAGVRPRLLPSIPWFSTFPELNVRTYVTDGMKPGVWFFSLDAGSSVAVEIARDVFHLPYYNARMSIDISEARVHYCSQRTHRRALSARFAGWYEPTGPAYYSAPGSLEAWLTERYCLYAADQRQRVWRGEIHHAQWPLQPATASITVNTMTSPLGFSLPRVQPLLHYTHRLDVVAWLPERIPTNADNEERP